MIRRNLAARLQELARQFPVVTLTGPRQSGKSTLAAALFPDKPVLSLENLDIRSMATQDPRGFLAQFPLGAVLDEIQKTPELLSYLQGIVDSDPTPGRWLLTGSSSPQLAQGVSQSLAGRSALVTLLPCSGDEVARFPAPPREITDALWQGGYPAIHDRGLSAYDYLASYAALYVDRDVRQLLNISKLDDFQTFVRLCAGRAAQLLNLAGLGGDAGISHTTAKSWLSAMEAGYLAFQLQPYSRSITSRLTRGHKLFFHDTGLMANFLGIEDPGQIFSHPLRGALFENWVVSETLKAFVHAARHPSLYFFRDRRGLEVDLLIERGRDLWLVEAKSSQTANPDLASNLGRLETLFRQAPDAPHLHSLVVYGGNEHFQFKGIDFLPWHAWPARLAELLGGTPAKGGPHPLPDGR